MAPNSNSCVGRKRLLSKRTEIKTSVLGFGCKITSVFWCIFTPILTDMICYGPWSRSIYVCLVILGAMDDKQHKIMKRFQEVQKKLDYLESDERKEQLKKQSDAERDRLQREGQDHASHREKLAIDKGIQAKILQAKKLQQDETAKKHREVRIIDNTYRFSKRLDNMLSIVDTDIYLSLLQEAKEKIAIKLAAGELNSEEAKGEVEDAQYVYDLGTENGNAVKPEGFEVRKAIQKVRNAVAYTTPSYRQIFTPKPRNTVAYTTPSYRQIVTPKPRNTAASSRGHRRQTGAGRL
jgi:hypothetical protein